MDILNIAGLREKLTALGDVEYEQKRRELAAEVGIRISVLDKTYRKLRGEQTRTARTPRPIIDPKSGDLPAILAKSWAALLENNKPVHLVNYGGAPARIIAPPDEAPRVEYLNVNSARYELANAAYWETSEGQPSRPDRDQIEMLLAAPTNQLPRLTRVVTIPVHDRDGRLIRKGYNECGLYYAPSIAIPQVSADPTKEEIKRAVAILWEPIHLFPFKTDADRAAAHALQIQTFAREFVEGPVPMFEVTAPDPGSGKGKLVKVLFAPAGAYEKIVPPERSDEAEWRKLITTALHQGISQLYIDNLAYALDSAAVASLVTETFWGDRLLGTNKYVRVPVPSLAITVNNGEFSRDMLRRLVPIGINAGMEHPEERDFTGYFDGDVEAWVRKPNNRAPMIWAILTLISAWLAAGRPGPIGVPSFGSFESWTHVMGGILSVAGIPGFLQNLYRGTDFSRKGQQQVAWKELTIRWWTRIDPVWSRDGARQETPATRVKDLLPIAREIPGIPLGRTAESNQPNEQSMITALGMALGKRRDRPINIKIGEKPLTLQVENAGEESGALLWKLVDITKAAATVVDTSSPTEEAEIDRLARQDEGIASPPAPDAQNDDYEPF